MLPTVVFIDPCFETSFSPLRWLARCGLCVYSLKILRHARCEQNSSQSTVGKQSNDADTACNAEGIAQIVWSETTGPIYANLINAMESFFLFGTWGTDGT
jgi:hypothetical protein